MAKNDWLIQHQRVVEALKKRLGSSEDCSQLVDSYEELLRSVWTFTERLLGAAGARAVLTRSIHLASSESPLITKVRVKGKGVDFTEVRDYVAASGCGSKDVIDAFTQLGVMVFTTLAELAGEALTEPLLRRLEEE